MHRTSEIKTNLEKAESHFISGALNIPDRCARPLIFEDLENENSFLE